MANAEDYGELERQYNCDQSYNMKSAHNHCRDVRYLGPASL